MQYWMMGRSIPSPSLAALKLSIQGTDENLALRTIYQNIQSINGMLELKWNIERLR